MGGRFARISQRVHLSLTAPLMASWLVVLACTWDPFAAPTCQSWASPTRSVLTGVVATSSSNAWAVGRWMCASRPDAPTRTVIFHWDGTAWKVQSSPNVNLATGYNLLNGVAATSATNAWAVGEYQSGDVYRTLMLHWDGTAWTRQWSPNVGESNNGLGGVAATSPSNAWAVGSWGGETPLILHWDGISWKRQPARSSVGAGIFPYLTGVAATSPSNAWAVGSYQEDADAPARTLILHWDGTAWKVQSTPNVGPGHNVLSGVAATSPSNARAVGWYDHGSERRALILHWDGTVWKRQSSPSVDMELNGVATISSSSAWAVGKQDLETLILCWNGIAWERQSSPNVNVGERGDNILNAVAATSSANAWAVGIYGDGTAAQTLVAKC